MVRLILSITALIGLMVAPLPPPSLAQGQQGDSWITLATQTLPPAARTAQIDVSTTRGRSKAVRIVVRQGSVVVEKVVITYSNGQVHYGDLPRPVALGSGQTTLPIDQRVEERFIDTVNLTYRITGRQAVAPQIEVQALQSRLGRLAERKPGAPTQVAASRPAAANGSDRAVGASRGGGGGGDSGGAPATAERKETPYAAAPPRDAAAPPRARSRSIAPAPSTPRSAEPAAAAIDDKKPYATVDLYFGTDRKREQDRKKWERQLASFGTQSDRRLTLGKAVVTVPKQGRERGQITRPEWDLIVARFSLRNEDLARDFTIFGVDVLDQRTWLSEVNKQRAQSRRFKDQALIFVHGFNVTFDDALFRAAQIAYDLEFDGVPFVFSWPSVGGLSGYVLDRNRARNAQDYLRQFIELIEKESGAKEIHLVAHSMGADPLLGALRDLAIATPPGTRPGKPRFNEVILAAPDVTRDNFEQIAERIVGLRKGMTLYASSNDRALQVSGILTLGEFPAGGVPSSGPLVMKGLDTIDVSQANTDFFNLNHSTFADRAQLLADIRGLIEKGIRPPNVRLSAYQLVTMPSGATYWRFDPTQGPITGSSPKR